MMEKRKEIELASPEMEEAILSQNFWDWEDKAQSHDDISEISSGVSQLHGGIAGVDQFIPEINTHLLSGYYVRARYCTWKWRYSSE